MTVCNLDVRLVVPKC